MRSLSSTCFRGHQKTNARNQFHANALLAQGISITSLKTSVLDFSCSICHVPIVVRNINCLFKKSKVTLVTDKYGKCVSDTMRGSQGYMGYVSYVTNDINRWENIFYSMPALHSIFERTSFFISKCHKIMQWIRTGIVLIISGIPF